MSKFLEKQLNSAESLKLGRAEYFHDYDAAKNTIHTGERAGDAQKRPRVVTLESFPLGRKQGICKPGDEGIMGRVSEGFGGIAGVPPALKKRRKAR